VPNIVNMLADLEEGVALAKSAEVVLDDVFVGKQFLFVILVLMLYTRRVLARYESELYSLKLLARILNTGLVVGNIAEYEAEPSHKST
jgi:hypothetical protein